MEDANVIDKDVVEKTLTFLFTVISDCALVPSLLVTARNRKHFEVFVGLAAILTGFLYNACDALDVSLFLTQDEWHRINNVMAITYVALLSVYIMNTENADWNTLLRYNAFACVTIAQVKDGFWMDNSQYTIVVVAFYALLPLMKFTIQKRIPKFRRDKTKGGLAFAALAVVFFMLGLDELNDAFRICHSIAHLFMGAALYSLWAIVPLKAGAKKRDKALSGIHWA